MLMLYFKSPSKPKNEISVQSAEIQKRINQLTHFPVILLELGGIQVYHFQTQDEFNSKRPYTEVFWRELGGDKAFGPFNSVFQACQHSNWYKYQEKASKDNSKIIQVDFKGKRRK